jgi:hypothetical protein
MARKAKNAERRTQNGEQLTSKPVSPLTSFLQSAENKHLLTFARAELDSAKYVYVTSLPIDLRILTLINSRICFDENAIH